MHHPGDVVIVDFLGATGTKRRPAVVVSSAEYHRSRPDAIIGRLTSQVASARGPTDYSLLDWQTAGLRVPSAFRSYLLTLERRSLVAKVGRVSDRDWQAIAATLRAAIG